MSYELQSAASSTEAGTVAALAAQAYEPRVLEPGKIYAIANEDGGVHIVDTLSYADHPSRKTGRVALADAQSMISYIGKHGRDESEYYAYFDDLLIIGIFDAHDADRPGWREHEAHVLLEATKAWKAWTRIDGNLLPQESFAEFLEQWQVSLVEPSGADMLELAQSFRATNKVRFESSKSLSTGQAQLTYVEDIDAKAGTRGQLTIPTVLTLGLQPFEGAKTYKVTARFRYRIVNGQLQLGIVLERPDEIIRSAFGDIVHEIEEGAGVTIWRGSPK